MSSKKRKHISSSDEDDDSDIVETPVRRRKNSTGSGNSPSKRRHSSDESSDDDDVADIKSLLPPNVVLQHAAIMKRLVGQKKTSASVAIKKYIDVAEFDGDKNQLRASLNKYLVMSIRPKFLDVAPAVDLLTAFLEGSEALRHYPDYPKKPTPLLVKYMHLNGMTNSGISSFKNASDAIKKDAKGRDKAEKEVEKEKGVFLKNLTTFLENREEDLSKAQASSLQAQIHRLDKTLHPENFPKRTPKAGQSSGRRKSVAPKTAYEVFLQLSLTDPEYSKYAELDDEKRNKKMKKKYEKLEENVKEVYEKMALVNSMSS